MGRAPGQADEPTPDQETYGRAAEQPDAASAVDKAKDLLGVA